MPRYYFNVSDEASLDELGLDLPSLLAARHEGARLMSDIMKDHPEHFMNGGDWTLTISNDESAELFQTRILINNVHS